MYQVEQCFASTAWMPHKIFCKAACSDLLKSTIHDRFYFYTVILSRMIRSRERQALSISLQFFFYLNETRRSQIQREVPLETNSLWCESRPWRAQANMDCRATHVATQLARSACSSQCRMERRRQEHYDSSKR